MKNLMLKNLVLMAFFALIFSPACLAQSQIAGDWQGVLNAGGAQLHLVLHITAAKDGSLSGTLDSVDQGANGIPVSEISLKDAKLSLTVEAVHGAYEGSVNKDATEIAGTWTQGQPLPLDFKRASAQPATAAAGPAAKPSLDGLDEFVTQVMKDWKVPGLAIAVVQDGKVTLLKGYGYRDMEKQLPVTPRTLFAIGSITKSFTVSTLGMEMDEGKVDWDKPVRDYLPSFKMYTPDLTEQLTIRDLITHRSGLPRHDLVWYSSDFPREDLLRRLQYLEPSKPLRTTFQYNNLMFMTAGYIAGQLNGTSWEDAITQRIFKPLEMNGTNFSELDTQNSADFAQPYRKGEDLKAELKRIPFDAQCPNRCAMGPAGEINSNVTDMSKYLLFHMSHGKAGGKQLLSENNSIQMQTPQMVIQGAPAYKEEGEGSYGMGFFISTYRGHKQVSHGGNIDGFSANLAFLPADKIGVVVLTNLDGNPAPAIVTNSVYDRLLGLDQVPWNQRLLASELGGKKAEQEAKDKGYSPRKPGTHPSHDLKDYAGDYSNPGYGMVTIALDGDKFQITLNKISKPLEHFHYDQFQVPADPLEPFQKMRVMFQTDMDGNISSLAMPLQPGVKDIVFTRMPDRQLTERSFIEPFTGDYETEGSPVPLKVSLRGENTLILTVPGQPDYLLNPKRGTTFELADLKGITIEFKRDAAGKVTEAVLNQLGTVLVLKKKQTP
ncbi:MAG: serine hydrolase [Terracidiphilus sp.]|jgi:CubicO group peptidase (beta-lactamase class C family)